MADDDPELTERELDILAAIAHGRTRKQIARDLTISTETVKTHAKAIYEKLNVHNKDDAAEWYWANITQNGGPSSGPEQRNLSGQGGEG